MAETMSPGLEGFGTDWCSPFLAKLPITGLSISAFPGHAPETSIYASDGTAARIDELQFDLGEGPRWEAVRTRRPVAIPNVKAAGHSGWPVFAKALLDLDVAALFTFPLTLGALDIGIVELYSSNPGPLNTTDHSMALQLTDALAWKLLQHILTTTPADNLGPSPDSSLFSRREVHQATGMVLAQTGTTATDALLLLRAHAFSQGLTVREVAHEVVNKNLDFSPPKAG